MANQHKNEKEVINTGTKLDFEIKLQIMHNFMPSTICI